jgi:hypothetical protein
MYFYLINLFGDVPLVTSTDYSGNAVMPRTPVTEIYNRIINDQTNAIDLLKNAYPSQGRARINKWVANALLCRVYLYTKDWQKAESAATVIPEFRILQFIADS